LRLYFVIVRDSLLLLIVYALLALVRILELTYEFPPLGGGGGIFTRDILSCIAAAGHQVDIVTMGARGLPAFQQIAPNIRLFRVFAARRDYNKCNFWQALLYLITGSMRAAVLFVGERQKYDCIHATFIFPSGVLAFVFGLIFRVPFVVTASGSDVPGHNRKLDSLFLILGPFWRLVVRKAASVTAVSAYLRALIQKQVNRKVEVIPNGIRASNFPQTTYGKKIITVGRLQQFKGFEYIFRALRGMNLKGYELVIAGDGPDRQRLEDLAQRLRVPVLFTGRLSRDVLLKQYASSSILISASLFESFSGVVMEAMACGLAVIATRVGGCPEVVGKAGILIEKANADAIRDALRSLLGDEESIRALGRSARQRVAQSFDLEMVARRYLHLFAQVAVR
jgi:glycosyltransferase involved in cell wall biosynthesis